MHRPYTEGSVHAHRRPGTRDPGPGTLRKGFTLTELLVVIAVTAVLMVMLFVPLSRSLDLVQRGNATVKAQDSVRSAMRVVSRDLSNAMVVYEPRPLTLWGYDSWMPNGTRPRPANGALPKKYTTWNTMVAFRLPKHRYYCTQFQHEVTPADMTARFGAISDYDMVAMGDCPRHPGAPIDFRALSPLEPEDRITLYFIALKTPVIHDPNDPGFTPRVGIYDNLLMFRQRALPNADYPPGWAVSELNTYTLYRAEFRPNDPRFANWTANGLPNGPPNPDFFYDTAADSNGRPFWMNWKEASTQVMDVEVGDVVKWVEAPGASPAEYVPHPLVTFGPSAVTEETAQPNRLVDQYALNGSALPSDVPPSEYAVDHAHWTGFQDDGRNTVPNAFISPNPPVGSARIEVRNPAGIVFDSLSAARHRLLSFDSMTGRVLFAIRRRNVAAENAQQPLDAEYFRTDQVVPEPNGTAQYTIDLKGDFQLDAAGMPSSFGEALVNWVPADSNRRAFITPGSDEVQVMVGGDVHRLKRAGWTGLPIASYDRIVAPPELETDEYTIDYSTGIITLAETDNAHQIYQSIQAAGNPATHAVLAAYSFQTNAVNDVVRVSYATREVQQVTIGIVEYTRRRREVLPFEISEQVVIRNMKR